MSSDITVNPNGDGVVAWTPSSGSDHYALVDEGVTSPNTADYILADAVESDDLQLEDMPGNFGVATSCTIKVHANRGGANKTNPTLRVRIVDSTELVALTDIVAQLIASGWATYSIPVTITGATDKASWDGAHVRLQGFNSQADRTILIAAAEVQIVYTVATNVRRGAALLGMLVD